MTAKLAFPEPVLEAIAAEDLDALRTALEGSPLAQALGIAYESLEPGRARARLPAGDLLPNFLGFAHTGALFALAEQVMAAAANTLGFVGLPLNCEIHFVKGADPSRDTVASAHVVDTQGRIARVVVEVKQDDLEILRVTEMVFLRTPHA
ncbi:PaaI family thioesterase [Deferrisoma palaeochoriense]